LEQLRLLGDHGDLILLVSLHPGLMQGWNHAGGVQQLAQGLPYQRIEPVSPYPSGSAFRGTATV